MQLERKGYISSEFGDICSDTRKDPIVIAEECEAAAYILYNYNTTMFSAVRSTKYPNGCYVERSGKVYWNLFEHLGQRNENAAELCHSASRNLKFVFDSYLI